MPQPHIAEIHLIGTGGGYGESIVIHIGNNEWIIIDSCQDPNTKKCLPLAFLELKQIDFQNIKLVICTHWHDDHVRGLSEILKNATQADFSFARTNDIKKFLQFVSLDYEKVKKVSSNSSTIEFNKCLEIINSRHKTIKFASIDRLLYSTSHSNIDISIFTLSPSDLSSQLFDKEISLLIEKFGQPNTKIINQSPNDRSVVILLKLGKNYVLLGADLEVSDNENLGWYDIVNNSQIIKTHQKSRYFKIPHHGSENGFLNDIWEQLLEDKPIATLTPWNKKNKLPRPEMLNKYHKLSKDLFITSSTNVSAKPKKRDHSTTKAIKQFNSSVMEIRYKYGVVSSYIDITDINANWNTELLGTAIKIEY